MARRNQPYIPLYADDFQTDEKLVLCSAESTGVFIRIMCLMHKSQNYGMILLNQKFKQTGNQISNFARQLAIFFPYPFDVIERSLNELINEDVLQLNEDFLCQKRMIRDGQLSVIRSESGKSGGKKSAKVRLQNDDFAQANNQPNIQANTQANIQPNTGIGIGTGIENGITNKTGLILKKNNEYSELLQIINTLTGRQFRGDSKSQKQFAARIKQGWTMDQFRKAIENATASQYHIESNFQYITPEFITREDKLDKFNAGTSNAAPSNRRIVGKTTEQDIRNNLEHFKQLWAQTKNNENQ